MTFLEKLQLIQERVHLINLRIEKLEKLYAPSEQPAQVEKEGPSAVDDVKQVKGK